MGSPTRTVDPWRLAVAGKANHSRLVLNCRWMVAKHCQISWGVVQASHEFEPFGKNQAPLSSTAWDHHGKVATCWTPSFFNDPSSSSPKCSWWTCCFKKNVNIWGGNVSLGCLPGGVSEKQNIQRSLEEPPEIQNVMDAPIALRREIAQKKSELFLRIQPYNWRGSSKCQRSNWKAIENCSSESP